MTNLRKLSTRPQVLVDAHGRPIGDSVPTIVGREAPLGRARIVFALPTNKSGPVLLQAKRVIVADRTALLADPAGTLIGVDGVWCHRYLAAAKTEDTRRL